MNHANTMKQKGFTLVELMLAMTFISMLLLAIALTIVQVANIYNRGILLREVNQVSRSISDELEQAIRSSSTFTNDPAARRYVNNQWGGRLCTGQFSYIWNYGKSLSAVSPNRNQYSAANPSGNIVRDNGTNRYEITFVKVPDGLGAYCVPDTNGRYANIDPTDAVELMRTGDHTLAIHNLTLDSAATAKDVLSGQQIYKISYTLGSSDINALTSDQSACKAPNVAGADFNYCSVQQFTIVVRVVSGVN